MADNFLNNFFKVTNDDKIAQLNLGITQKGVIPVVHDDKFNPNFQLGVGVNAPVLDVSTSLLYLHDG